jgi:hypothetical protein
VHPLEPFGIGRGDLSRLFEQPGEFRRIAHGLVGKRRLQQASHLGVVAFDEGGQAGLPEPGPQVLDRVDPGGTRWQVTCQVAAEFGGGPDAFCKGGAEQGRFLRVPPAPDPVCRPGSVRSPLARSLAHCVDQLIQEDTATHGSYKRRGQLVGDAVFKQDGLKDGSGELRRQGGLPGQGAPEP